MSHLINFGLFFSFLTLAFSGILSFIRPFSITVARFHIVFAMITLVLIALHLYAKLPYFKKQFKVKGKLIFFLTLTWLVLLTATWLNYPPVQFLVEQSYEAQNRKEIVRTNSLVATIVEDNLMSTFRQNEDKNQTNISLYLSWDKSIVNSPAVAIWAESKNGTIVETLYMEDDLAFSDKPKWHGKETPRHHIFPVWRHRYTTINGLSPEGKIDTRSGATSNHQFSLNTHLKSDGEPFVIFIEINAHGDTDKNWTDPHLGQPSVLYSVYVEPSKKVSYFLFELTGQGSGAIADGAINYDLEVIGNAKRIVDLALVKLNLAD